METDEWPAALRAEAERLAEATLRRLPGCACASAEDREDMRVAALAGAWRAYQTYREERGTWATWLVGCIRHALLHEMRRLDHLTRTERRRAKAGEPIYARPVSLDAIRDPEGEEAGEPVRLRDTLLADADAEREALECLQAARLWQMVQSLPGREARILWAHYHDSRLLRDVARDLGLSKSRVTQLHSHGLQLLREALR